MGVLSGQRLDFREGILGRGRRQCKEVFFQALFLFPIVARLVLARLLEKVVWDPGLQQLFYAWIGSVVLPCSVAQTNFQAGLPLVSFSAAVIAPSFSGSK